MGFPINFDISKRCSGRPVASTASDGGSLLLSLLDRRRGADWGCRWRCCSVAQSLAAGQARALWSAAGIRSRSSGDRADSAVSDIEAEENIVWSVVRVNGGVCERREGEREEARTVPSRWDRDPITC